MNNLFGMPRATSTQQPPAMALRIQNSAQGNPIPIGWGRNRLAPNLLYYTDFQVYWQQVAGANGGGKGGVGGGSSGKFGASGGGTEDIWYTTAVIYGLCEGPIIGLGGAVWESKNIKSAAQVNLALFDGDYAQTAWSYVSVNHPGDARNYRGIAYLAGVYFLGASPDLPTLSIEVQFSNVAVGGGVDSSPRDILLDFLTNTHYGVGFPSSRIGDSNFTALYNFTQAAGLFMSPLLVQQTAANSFLTDLMYGCVAEAVWSGGQLKVVPYYDQFISGNGASFTPNTTPIYDLTDDDFLPGANNSYQSPVICTRRAVTDIYNSVSVSYPSRANQYNTMVYEAKDDAKIQAYGLRKRDTKTTSGFCLDSSAQLCAQLQLGREQVEATYQFTVGAKYVLLDPMDCVTITDAHLGLSRKLVRIKEITENQDFSLTILAEEVLLGAASPPLYGQQANTGYVPNYNADPGLTLAPFFFEPTDPLAGGLEIWMAVTAANLAIWGGCNVYVSYDNVNYQYVGRQRGPTRFGSLTANLASMTPASTPPTIDTTNTLSVNLAQSKAQLLNATNADMLAAATLCYVGSSSAGEYLAYQTSVSTGANAYNLTTLNRGLYGTSPNFAGPGTTLVRLDAGVFRIPFTQDRIGQTIYIKLVNFNAYGAGPQTLASVAPYTYVIQGTALVGPLPDVQNFTTNYQSNITLFSWDEIKDFRSPIDYEIRRGTDWGSGQVVGRYLHPNVPAIGSTLSATEYLIKAHCQPLPGLDVYSVNAAALVIVQGSAVIPLNIVKSYDEFATGLTGTFGGSASNVSGTIETAAGPTTGTYTIPSGHIINVGRATACLVDCAWTASGVPVSQNIFSWTDVFAQTDIFASVANKFITGYPEINTSPDGVTWNGWQKYRAGFYTGAAFNMRMQLASTDPQTLCAVSAFTYAVHIPSRIDHYIGLSVPATSGGLSLTFQPDGAASTAAFNGGPGGTPGSPGLPTYQITITNEQSGDVLAVSSLTTSGCVIKITNGGSPVARTINAEFAGY